MKAPNLIEFFLIAGMLMSLPGAALTVSAQSNTNDVADLQRRVAQLEKQVQEMSQFLEPLRGEQATIASRRKALQQKVEKQFNADRDKYSLEEVLEAEKLYQLVSQKPDSPEEKDSVQTLLKKYPDMNRTGCAMLYVAQRAKGDERVKQLQLCLEKFGDCIYGDGVQVGAYARFLLAKEFSAKGDEQKADALCNEIKTSYADAIDHAGNLLVDLTATLKK